MTLPGSSRSSITRPCRRGGHPQGLEWFCDEHYEAAEAFRALALDAALARMRDEIA